MEEVTANTIHENQEVDFIELKAKEKKQKMTIIGAIASFVVVCLIAVYLVFLLTGQLTSVAADFLRDIKNKDYDAAYALMSTEFHDAVPLETFDLYIGKKRLDKIISTKWQEREMEKIQGKLIGTIVTDLGISLPYEIYFVKQNDQWKIEKVRDVLAEEELQTLTTIQAKRLVNQTLENFTRVVGQKNLQEFYNGFSESMKNDVSYDDFLASFQVFYGNEVYLKDVLANPVEITFNDVIDPDLNLIIISGKFNSEYNQLDFEIGFIPDNEVWRIASLYLAID